MFLWMFECIQIVGLAPGKLSKMSHNVFLSFTGGKITAQNILKA
jgi:hypothetical protein